MLIYKTVEILRKNLEELYLNANNFTHDREKKIKYAAVVLIALLMFSLILVFNGLVGCAADDYLYFFKYTGHVVKGRPERLTGIGDIFTGMVTHYKICNGRIPAHFLLQLFTLADKSVFNVANSIIFTLLGLLIYSHANYNRPVNIPLLVFVYAFEWFGFCKPATSFLWYSAAFNYPWATTWILIFLMAYRVHSADKEKNSIGRETLLSLLMLAAGIFAGWTNENMGGATIGAVILYLIYYKIRHMSVRPHHLSGLFGSVIGFGILILAPGNKVRLDNTHRERNIFKHLLWSLSQLSINIIRAVIMILIVSLIVFIISRVKKKKIDWLLPCIYALAGAAAAGVLILSPEAPPRAFFGANVMLACGAFSLAAQITDVGIRGVKKAAAVISVCLAAMFAVFYVGEYYALKADNMAYHETEQAIYEQKKDGIMDVEIPLSHTRDAYWSLDSYMMNITNDNINSEWFNNWAAEYYGVHSVTVIEKAEK